MAVFLLYFDPQRINFFAITEIETEKLFLHQCEFFSLDGLSSSENDSECELRKISVGNLSLFTFGVQLYLYEK